MTKGNTSLDLAARLEERHKEILNSYNELGTRISGMENDIEKLREARIQLVGILEYNRSIIAEIRGSVENAPLPGEEGAEPVQKETAPAEEAKLKMFKRKK